MVLKIKEMNIVNPLESEVSIYKTNMSLDDINFNSNLLRIIDFIKNQEFYIANKISFRSSIFSFQGTSATCVAP